MDTTPDPENGISLNLPEWMEGWKDGRIEGWKAAAVQWRCSECLTCVLVWLIIAAPPTVETVPEKAARFDASCALRLLLPHVPDVRHGAPLLSRLPCTTPPPQGFGGGRSEPQKQK